MTAYIFLHGFSKSLYVVRKSNPIYVRGLRNTLKSRKYNPSRSRGTRDIRDGLGCITLAVLPSPRRKSRGRDIPRRVNKGIFLFLFASTGLIPPVYGMEGGRAPHPSTSPLGRIGFQLGRAGSRQPPPEPGKLTEDLAEMRKERLINM